jgi:HD superfamily phosphohydrolase
MYWQVYLHKTVIAAEQLLVKILESAKELAKNGEALFATPALKHFLYKDIKEDTFLNDKENLYYFSLLDDHDVMSSIKVWQKHQDFILNTLCTNLISRNLYKVEISGAKIDQKKFNHLKEKVQERLNLDKKNISYFVFKSSINNMAYKTGSGSINILMKDGTLQDIATASDNANVEALSKTVTKNILCYTKFE